MSWFERCTQRQNSNLDKYYIDDNIDDSYINQILEEHENDPDFLHTDESNNKTELDDEIEIPCPDDSKSNKFINPSCCCHSSDLKVTEFYLNLLKKIKQLQQKRELSEVYYTRKIKKIIDKYFTSNYDNILYNEETSDQHQSCMPHQEQCHKDMKPCGAVTRVKLLDCGCLEKCKNMIYMENQRKNPNLYHKFTATH